MKFCQVEICQSPVFSGKFCKRHQYLRKKSDEQKTYEQSAKKFKEDNKVCQANLIGCTKVASKVHHKRGRVGKNLNDTETFLAVCANCHKIIEEKPAFAKALGLSDSRLSIQK